jgi:Protein of unknown function (DUF3261)
LPVAGLLSSVGFFLAACAHQEPPPTANPGPQLPTAADLPPPDTIPGSFTVRQKLVAKSEKGGGSFEAVLQKRPGHVTILGLLPIGARAFVLEHDGKDVKVTNYLPRDPPFPPHLVLLDVYRVFGAWLGPPPPADGEREGTVRGERIHERWRAGRLVERTFVRAGSGPPGTISITYEGEALPGVAENVTIKNARFGYALSIHSVPP